MKLIIIGGATASGKTSLSVNLAKALKGEVISADSMQIYRGMDIGTNKITEKEKEGVTHHLLSYVEPNVDYSVSEYSLSARSVIDKLLSSNVQPIIVGGTGFYINSIIKEQSFGNVKKDEVLRKKFCDFADKYGNEALFNELKKVDPEESEKLKPNDLKRVIRALEIFTLTGEKKSSQKDDKILYDYKMFCIDVPRDLLYANINKRVDEMVDNGLVDEVRNLLTVTDKTALSMSAIGYKEIIAYLDGDCSLNEAVESIKQNTRNYAKRQITWFKHQADPLWIPYDVENKTQFVIENLGE